MKSKVATAAALVLSGVFVLSTFAQTLAPNRPAQWYALSNPKIIDWDGEVYTVEHASGVARIPWAQMPEWIRHQQTPASLVKKVVAAPAAPEPKADSSLVVFLKFVGGGLLLVVFLALVPLRIWWFYWVFRPQLHAMQEHTNLQIGPKSRLRNAYMILALLFLWLVIDQIFFR